MDSGDAHAAHEDEDFFDQVVNVGRTQPPAQRAEYSQVREPTPSELKAMKNVLSVATWARLRGDLAWAPSPLGSLLRLLTGSSEVGEDEL